MAGLQESAARAASRGRDSDAARKACEDMNSVREEIRKRDGALDIGMPVIRELRDE
jgi:hypothetical protein